MTEFQFLNNIFCNDNGNERNGKQENVRENANKILSDDPLFYRFSYSHFYVLLLTFQSKSDPLIYFV